MKHSLVMAIVLLAIASCSVESGEGARPGKSAPTAAEQTSATQPPNREAEARSVAEWTDRLISCLREEGWAVALTEDGFEVEVGQDNDEAFQASETACTERIGAFPTPAPPTEQEIEGLYALNLKAVQCLKEQGITVEPPPSLELYVEQYRQSLQGGPAPWSPYANVENLAAVEGACPQPGLEDL